MDQVTLGHTGLRCSRLGFGCSRIASLGTPYGPAEVRATIEEAIAEGITLFDTANVYGQGDSERILGAVMRGRRNQVVLATKAGLHVGLWAKPLRWVKPVLQPLVRRLPRARARIAAERRERERQCFSPDYLQRQLDASLARLRTDYVDIFFLHGPPLQVLERAEIVEFAHRTVHSGKARFFGVSCADRESLLLSAELPEFSIVQVAASRAHPEALTDGLPQAHAASRGVILREIFAGGALAQEDDGKPSGSSALRFLLDRRKPEALLCGMNCRQHLRANLAVLRNFESAPRAGK